MQKIKKNIFIIIIFYFFVIFSKRFKQNFLISTESCFLDGKKPNRIKLVYINFLADSVKICQDIELAKFKDNWLSSSNPMKMCLLGYFCMQNSFLHRKWRQNLWFLRNMQKKLKKNIYYYFLFF